MKAMGIVALASSFASPKTERRSWPVEEPVKRSAKKTEEAPAEKKDLSKILADWDDE